MPTIINGDGVVTAGGTASTQGRVVLAEQTGSGTNTVTIQAPATLAADLTFTMPTADGTNGQVLQTNGSGALSFVNQTAPTSLATPLAVIGNATAGAEIRLPEDTDNGSNYVALKAADSIASNLTFTLPSADGTNGQVLQTNGSGALSFATISTGVTEIGSVARVVADKNMYIATPSNAIVTGGAKKASEFSFSGATIPSYTLARYSTYYSAWYASVNSILVFSTDGINFTPVLRVDSSMTGLSLDGGNGQYCPFVVNDSDGRLFAFGTTSAGYRGYIIKSSISGSWGSPVNLTSAVNLWYAEYVSFADAASSGIVIGWSTTSTHYVATIAAGGSADTTRATTSNSNGQAMMFEWNKTANVAMSVQRTPSAGQAALFLSPTGNINASWTSVTNTTTGFSPGSNIAQTRPIISNAGYGLIWEEGNNSYRYTATTTLNGAWTSGSTPDGNTILYIGHNGTVWYMATGTTGTSGNIQNFYTTSSATPTGWASYPAIPIFNPAGSTQPYNIQPIPNYSQRKY